jgi:peptide/nickel transport system substrate-binding protein
MNASILSRRNFLAATAGMAAAAAATRSAAQTTRILRTCANNPFQVFDPPNRISDTNESVMTSIFGGLVRWKPGNEWGWELDLAASVEQVDPTHIKFQLKPGIPWSNGYGEVTAEDVKFSYERIADPAFHASYRTDWDALDHVEITDAHAGVIILKRPFVPLWTTTMPSGSGLIMCKAAVEKLEGKKFTLDPPATCGPYRIQKIEPQRMCVLERNPLWPGKKPWFDEIHFLPIVDTNAAETAFDAGELDYTTVPIGSVPRLRNGPPAHGKLRVSQSLNYWWLGMQSEAGPFADIRVRKAAQLAVDVDAIIQGAFSGVPARATGIVAPGLVGHRPANLVKGPDYDKARQLLAEAGHGNGIKTTITVRNSAEFTNAAVIASASLAKAGIDAEVVPSDPGAIDAMATDKNGAWKRMGMIINRFSSQADPSWATAWFVSSQIGQWNWERFASPEFDRLHEEAKSELDEGKRNAMYIHMQDLMEQSGSYVFLTHGVNASLARDTIIAGLSPDGLRQNFRDFTAG